MIQTPEQDARGLLDFIDASPSPFHACEQAAAFLQRLGFSEVSETEGWPRGAGRRYLKRGGSLVAWCVEEGASVTEGFRVLAAHTDSPNLRIKPRPDTGRAGCRQLGVETYGSPLLNSWLDRDLGLSGRVMVRGADGRPDARLLLVDRPVLRIPQLAVHLDREIYTNGLQLDKQTHMAPVWSLDVSEEQSFREFAADELGVEADAVLSWDVMTHDVQPSSTWGLYSEFLAAPRLDNLCSSYAVLRAIEQWLEAGAPGGAIPVVTFFDHEEVGSSSERGAASPVLKDVLERIVLAMQGGREEYHRAIAASFCCSADMAHATHPNYVERHEPDHHLHMNAGPVIKINTNMRYASDAEGEAAFQTACERADVPFQKWVTRSNMACGSTIGPITAANLGMRTIDVGAPQLAMHSARESCGVLDPGHLGRAMAAFLG